MATFTYPTSAELKEIEQVRVQTLTQDDPIFQLFPIEEEDHHLLKWEKRDNDLGLKELRGLNGESPRVKKTGLKQ